MVQKPYLEKFNGSQYRQTYYNLLTQSDKPFNKKLGFFSYFTHMTKTSLLEE